MGTTTFDIIVIGGGPAGLIASGRAAELGSKTALFEKNASLGRKLLLTGNGRCNLTNNGNSLRDLVGKYGKNGRFLYHAFSLFGVPETINFFNKRGLPTKAEEDGRVFPASERAADVLRVLRAYAERADIITGAPVEGLEPGDSYIKGVKVNGELIRAKNFILCTGGKSFPNTGSTGEAFHWLRSLGHEIIQPAPALVPITVKEDWIRNLEGASLNSVNITLLQSGKKMAVIRGDAVVTANGLSGPAILNASRRVRELLKEGEVFLLLDLIPDVSIEALQDELLRSLSEHPNRLIKSAVTSLLPPKLSGVLLMLAGIDEGRRLNTLTKNERRVLIESVKKVAMTVKGTQGFERAYVTSGGVSLREIDHMTMRSKLYKNLYFAGEVIDIDGPSGGYNLQAAWSTGHLAGESAAGSK
ncbi:MAG: NAD(P)/FAD-dependent oxidoreductase [Nitrospirota bacterium]